MLGKDYEQINVGNLKNSDTNNQRIFQKLFFDKEIFDKDFFNVEKINDTDISFLNVKQLDNDIRAFIIGNFLYKFTPDNPLYNYLDTGRAVYIGDDYCLIFNNLNVDREDLISINEWADKDISQYNFKEIWQLSEKRQYGQYNKKIYLLFDEDITKIKSDFLKVKEQELLEERKKEKYQKEQELLDKENEKKLNEIIKNFRILDRIEDKDIIIENNYFIEKEKGLKIVFNKKITEIIPKDDLFMDYDCYLEKCIRLNLQYILKTLAEVYSLGKYDGNLNEKVKSLNLSNNKYLLHFKVYSYNLETKAEELLSEIKIENKWHKNKYKFFINGITIPKAKMSFAIEFMESNYLDTEETKNRFRNINTFLEQVKRYSGTQLDLLKGKVLTMNYQGLTIPLHFEINNPDFSKDNWQITFNNYKTNRDYDKVKELFRSYYGNSIVDTITLISENLGNKFEDIIIDYVKVFIEKRKQAGLKAKQLFMDFIIKNKTRIIPKDDFYIVKGKLKNYKLAFRDEEDVGVWTYPNNNYVCINEKDKKGQELVGYDKMLQFALVLINDSGMREEINTLNR